MPVSSIVYVCFVIMCFKRNQWILVILNITNVKFSLVASIFFISSEYPLENAYILRTDILNYSISN